MLRIGYIMPIHPRFVETISDNPRYMAAVNALAESADPAQLNAYIKELSSSDILLINNGVPTESIYKNVFARTVVPRISHAILSAIEDGSIPSILISFTELDEVRRELSLPSFGSPQDVLYTFTSDRALDWGITLSTLKFQCACMVGEAKVIVTIAPRFVDVSNPDFETLELSGAISLDFWESNAVVGSVASFAEICESISIGLNLFPNVLFKDIEWTIELIHNFVDAVKNQNNKKYTCLLIVLLKEIGDLNNPNLVSKWEREIRKKKKIKNSQEQIALKYIEEGRFLQKLLGGVTVDHLQSNVKMQKNPLRLNKVEVDSIYRAIGKKQIILVEAKDNLRVSRTQLYSIYEAYRLRIPNDWTVTVVAALLQRPSSALRQENQTIDLIEIEFDDQVLGDIPESLFAVKPKRHFRWTISQ
jgi:hypothetical protein